MIGAGEPLNPEVIEQVEKAWGLTIRDGYGQTETTRAGRQHPRRAGEARLDGPAAAGRARRARRPADRARWRPTRAGEGEICLDLSAAAAAADDRLPGRRRAQRRGDGRRFLPHRRRRDPVDADGYITYVGRTDDVFKASDYKISPFELESVLIEHPAVAEAAVVPAPDPVRLAVPKAYVALAPGLRADARRRRCAILELRARAPGAVPPGPRASSSSSCRRRSRARSAGSSCAAARTSSTRPAPRSPRSSGATTSSPTSGGDRRAG